MSPPDRGGLCFHRVNLYLRKHLYTSLFILILFSIQVCKLCVQTFITEYTEFTFRKQWFYTYSNLFLWFSAWHDVYNHSLIMKHQYNLQSFSLIGCTIACSNMWLLDFDKIMGDFQMPILHANSNYSFRNLILILVLVFEVLPSFLHQKQNSDSLL